MVLECYNWILHIFKQIIGDHYNDNKWQKLITSSGCGSRKSRERPQILCYSSSSGLKISIIDGKSTKESTKEWKIWDFKSNREAFFVSCCHGLTLFTLDILSKLHIVVNPLLKETIEIIWGPQQSHLCGFFFHPLAKEYRILSVHKIEADNYEYQLYVLGTKRWRKAANPCYNRSPESLSSTGSRRSYNPAIVNNALHWDIGGIMVFDMISEQFSVRCPPFEGAYKESSHLTRHLSVKDDRLCFCYVGFQEAIMDIWILEDYVKWSWIRKYVVDLDWDMIRYPMDRGYNGFWHSATGMEVIGIQNNELVLLWRHRGIFSYHLGSNTLEKFRLKKSDWLLSGSFEAYNG